MQLEMLRAVSQGKHCCDEWQTETIGAAPVAMETGLSIWAFPSQDSQSKASQRYAGPNSPTGSTHHQTNTAGMTDRRKQWVLPLTATVTLVSSNLP